MANKPARWSKQQHARTLVRLVPLKKNIYQEKGRVKELLHVHVSRDENVVYCYISLSFSESLGLSLSLSTPDLFADTHLTRRLGSHGRMFLHSETNRRTKQYSGRISVGRCFQPTLEFDRSSNVGRFGVCLVECRNRGSSLEFVSAWRLGDSTSNACV